MSVAVVRSYVSPCINSGVYWVLCYVVVAMLIAVCTNVVYIICFALCSMHFCLFVFCLIFADYFRWVAIRANIFGILVVFLLLLEDFDKNLTIYLNKFGLFRCRTTMRIWRRGHCRKHEGGSDPCYRGVADLHIAKTVCKHNCVAPILNSNDIKNQLIFFYICFSFSFLLLIFLWTGKIKSFSVKFHNCIAMPHVHFAITINSKLCLSEFCDRNKNEGMLKHSQFHRFSSWCLNNSYCCNGCSHPFPLSSSRSSARKP